MTRRARKRGPFYFYLTDQVDSVKVVLDDDGNAITRFEYLPYGEEWITETDAGIEEQHNPKYDPHDVGSVRRGRMPKDGPTARSLTKRPGTTTITPGTTTRRFHGLPLRIMWLMGRIPRRGGIGIVIVIITP